MRIIVTGGSGLGGRFTVEELARGGHEVINVDRAAPKSPLPGSFIQIDLTDAGEVYDVFAQVKPQGVAHLAANPSPQGFSRQGTFQNNIMATYNMMQAAGDFGAQRFIYASSEMATGWLTTEELPKRFPFDESDRATTPNAYALSKYLGEVIADSMSVRYPKMSIVSLRINNIIPPDDYARLEPRRKDPMHHGDGNFWSYIDARDVATAFRASLEGQSAGHEVFLIAAADTCIEIPIQQAVKDRYGDGANFAGGHPPQKSVFNCAKIKQAFGWEPKHSWRNQK
ncbi:MAG TPA: NAD(P)-dependent oxidoreductase [Tepidisphaeraceae bacterium]|nr:NAD(P)-dependent oxidoreductase [Tepidisphaeraceae bacterium]